MDESKPNLPAEPDPLGQSQPVTESTSARFPQGPSPLGPVGQYRPPTSILAHPLQSRLSQAQSFDAQTKKSYLRNPEWAAPKRAIGQTILDYFFSVLTYWFGYGLIMALVLLLGTLILGQMQEGSADLLGRIFAFGPLMGLLFDVALLNQSTLLSALGAGFIICEFVLFFLLLFTHDWGGRLRYCGFMLGLVLGKAAILLLATTTQ
jgi:hypothetical protein